MAKKIRKTVPKDALDTRMSANKVNLETRISARVSNSLYLAMRLIASSQSMTIEQKIAELCKKEVEYISRQKWFIELIQNGGADDIQPILDLLDKRRNASLASGDDSDFDSNNVSGGTDYEPI